MNEDVDACFTVLPKDYSKAQFIHNSLDYKCL